MSATLEHLPLIVIIFLCLCLVTALSNQRALRRIESYPAASLQPRVSILVPARNEARNIEACVQSLLDQDYPDFEVLVLDDHSTDETRSLLTGMARRSERLRILDGDLLPHDWLGKHWACHQLAQAATGELLLFTDADTRHHPQTLGDSVAALNEERADLVSVFPLQEVVSWAEKVIIPVIGWGIFTFVPFRLAQRFNMPGLSVTIGQFMLFKRRSFEAIGGYEAVKIELVDDVALGRLVIEGGYKWRLLDGTARVRCRMYHGFREIVEGFSKNVFAFFEHRLVLYLIAWSWLAIVFLRPALALLSQVMGTPMAGYPVNLAAIAVGQSLLLWRMAYKRFGFSLYLAFFYPISLSLFLLIVVRSLVVTLTGHTSWKGRSLVKPATRWL